MSVSGFLNRMNINMLNTKPSAPAIIFIKNANDTIAFDLSGFLTISRGTMLAKPSDTKATKNIVIESK